MNKLGFIKKQLVKLYGKEKTDVIVDLAQKHYQECLELCKDASKGEWTHLEDTILRLTVIWIRFHLKEPKHWEQAGANAILVL